MAQQPLIFIFGFAMRGEKEKSKEEEIEEI
jgi:hypothetical protein